MSVLNSTMSFTDPARILRGDSRPDGQPLSREEREKLLKPYLPAPRRDDAASQSELKTSLLAESTRIKPPASISYTPRSLVNTVIHKILFHVIQFIVSIYVWLRQAYHAIHNRILSVLYYHHRTPELIRKDVKNLGRIPRHLSVIVDLNEEDRVEAVQRLIGEVAELASWCACVGIEMLSVYEKTGELH